MGLDEPLGRDSWAPYARRTPQARVRLFCFPDVGGDASVFRTWVAKSPAQVEVCPVQLPGRENRSGEPLVEQVQPLARMLSAALRPKLDVPFAFLGHGLGAVVAFELARELRRAGGVAPEYLFVSACDAPHVPRGEPMILRLPDSELVAHLLRRKRIPRAVVEGADRMEAMVPVLRADLTAQETYVYEEQPRLDCPIFALGGSDDVFVARENLEAWQHHSTRSFAVCMIPGDHLFLIDSSSLVLSAVSRELTGCAVPGALATELAPGQTWHFPHRLPEPSADVVHVWRARLDGPASELEGLWKTLSGDERRRAERFVFPQHRDRFVAGRGMLRALLGSYLSRDPGGLEFVYGPQGKPALSPECGGTELRFNLAHSVDLALYAVARHREIGVDLEHVRPEVAETQIAERYFSKSENSRLGELPADVRTPAFFHCWTRKEAYLKAVSRGLSLALDSFDVSVLPGEAAALLATRHDPQDVHRWTMHDLDPASGFVGAVAAAGSGWRLWCGNWPLQPGPDP